MSRFGQAYTRARGYQRGVEAAWKALPSNTPGHVRAAIRELREAAAEARITAREAWQLDVRQRRRAARR